MFARIGAYLAAISIVACVRPSLPELQRDDVSDVHAADAHVGLFGERQRAREARP